jgi:hypothetical protein
MTYPLCLGVKKEVVLEIEKTSGISFFCLAIIIHDLSEMVWLVCLRHATHHLGFYVIMLVNRISAISIAGLSMLLGSIF